MIFIMEKTPKFKRVLALAALILIAVLIVSFF